MKILIITVGNRQIGWTCRDGVVRCPGVSGNPNDNIPDHVSQIYAEIGQEKPKLRQYVRHLGKLLYDRCSEESSEEKNFSAVELLLDQKIIEQEYQSQDNLEEIWLIGTDQPEEINSDFRSGDTLWLVKLMAGKIKQTWQDLRVETLNLEVNAGKIEDIRNSITAIVQTIIDRYQDTQLTILIENKGSVPAIASSLEICLAALTRLFVIKRVVPQEPSPMFDPQTESAKMAEEFNYQLLNQYFFPLEKQKIISAWEKGSFGEAKVWLQGHQERYKFLYELAKHLDQARNWEITNSLKSLKNWLSRKDVKKKLSQDLYSQWQLHLDQVCVPTDKETKENRLFRVWESCFLMKIELDQEHSTMAFLHFSQTLERLLFLRYRAESWLEQGFLVIPENKKLWGENYKPELGALRIAFSKAESLSDDSPICKLLSKVNEVRNSLVHRAEPKTLSQLSKELFVENTPSGAEAIFRAMDTTLRTVCGKNLEPPTKPILQLLHEWGLEVLRQ